MTSSIPIDNLASAADTVRRDQWGRYLIVPPGGGKPVGYTRVTTIAKTLDSGGGLAPWKAAMTASGVIMRRGLRAQWEQLLAQSNGDPWYGGEQHKTEAKRLVEESAAAGGANDRREIGSALHAITALVDTGQTPKHLTAETEADLRAYSTGLALSGIDIDDDVVEVTVVLDEWQVAGTFDRIVHVPGFDLPLVADLKTGADLSYSWQSIAVQLAAYSRADDIYTQGANKDGTQDTRRPFPDVDKRHGLVMWLPAGSAKLELFIVDLDAGWTAFDASVWCREWRNRKDLATPLSEYSVDLPEPAVPSAQDGPPNADMTGDLLASVVEQGSQQSVRDWLQGRIEVIGQDPAARTMLRDHWPPHIASLRASSAHSTLELVTIELVLDGVERACGLGFPDRKPTPTLIHQPAQEH